jgi:18S rRNA (guanine1575-N7)-methyltransferase
MSVKAGFSGGLVVDFPHSTRAKKYFLVLMVGGGGPLPTPQGVDGERSDEEGTIAVAGRGQSRKKRRVGGPRAGVRCHIYSVSSFMNMTLKSLE